MFPFKYSGWLKRISGIWQGMQQWIAPPARSCLLCNRTSMAGLICVSCQQSIPWITEVYCTICGRHEKCGDCSRRKETFFVSNRSAVQYDTEMKNLLALYKFRGNERLLPLFVEMLVYAYRMHVQDLQQAGEQTGFLCVTYVPISEERRRERGFNQAEQMADQLGQRIGIPVIPLLKRTKDTNKQSLKTRQQRMADLDQAFTLDETGYAVFNQFMIKGAKTPKILLVDDVYTTGSTLSECSKTISSRIQAGIYGLTWAR